jgi:rhodanese-related sulfurtransferase/DNA-binding transcriptional ArsR family regulator
MRTSEHRRNKDALYEQFAKAAGGFASGKRFELLSLLAQGPRTVEALAGQAEMSLANTSQHLQVLRRAGLVSAEKRGLFVTYRLADEQVGQVILALQGLARDRLAEVERIKRGLFAGAEDVEPVDREVLLARARRGEVTVLDVRPEEEYRAGHFPGAVSIPISELEQRLGELPREREVVAYCRGPYCVYAAEAVELLRKKGYRGARLEEGVLEWRANGLPLEGEGAAR